MLPSVQRNSKETEDQCPVTEDNQADLGQYRFCSGNIPLLPMLKPGM